MLDVAILSASPTLGWRAIDESFAALVRDAGATCELTRVTVGPAGALRRHPAVTDLVEALAARHGASRLPPARAVVISTVTASFLQRDLGVPVAVRFDAPAAMNRPGPAGAWQRRLEPRALARARVLLPLSEEAAGAVRVDGPQVIPLGVPIDRISPAPRRDVDAVAYAGNPHKRRLDLLCAAWEAAGTPGRLRVGGIEAGEARSWLARRGIAEPSGLEWAGRLPRAEWLSLLASAKVFVNASRFEDHGIAALEALSAGAALVTVPAPGPYPGLAMATSLDPALVAAEASAPALAAAMLAGLSLSDAARRDYAERAGELLAPHRIEALRRTVAERVLPALGIG